MDKELYTLAHGLYEHLEHAKTDAALIYGFYEALERAYAMGVEDHVDDARLQGHHAGWLTGFDYGRAQGFDEGTDASRDSYEQGWRAGFAAADEEAGDSFYEQGFADGYDEAHADEERGYDEGFDEGWQSREIADKWAEDSLRAINASPQPFIVNFGVDFTVDPLGVATPVDDEVINGFAALNL